MAGSTHWLYGIIGLALLSIFFSARELQLGSARFTEFPLSKATEPSLQLVVFGDSWSDNGVYRVDSPKPAVISVQPEAKGQVWTEYLCSALACKHENYARPAVIEPVSADLIGVFVDNHLHKQNTTMYDEPSQRQADLKSQVEQWTVAQESRQLSETAKQQRDESTVYVMQFGFWDIWSSANQDKETASYAIAESIDVIFSALDFLADSSEITPGLRVILTLAPDISFLPGYSRNNVEQRHAIALTDLWNTALTERAEHWGRGEIYLYDVNNFMLDHIRTHQMSVVGLSDSEGLGTQDPMFEDVETACASVFETETALPGTVCQKPDDHLFWDEFHLGQKAHKLIADEILQDLKSQATGWIQHGVNVSTL